MKTNQEGRWLRAAVTIMGIAAMALRRMLYLTAVDEKHLLVWRHPLEIAVAGVSAAVLVFVALAAFRCRGSERYEDNYPADVPAALGHIAAAAGIFCVVWGAESTASGYIGMLWQLLGFVSPVCLVLAGVARMRNQKPFFLLHMIPCLFFVLHIVNNYQTWSSNPQLQDYVFSLLGAMALTFFAFYTAAFAADCGNRRMVLGSGLAAMYLCLAELGWSGCPALYLGGFFWALTGMCSVAAEEKE